MLHVSYNVACIWYARADSFQHDFLFLGEDLFAHVIRQKNWQFFLDKILFYCFTFPDFFLYDSFSLTAVHANKCPRSKAGMSIFFTSKLVKLKNCLLCGVQKSNYKLSRRNVEVDFFISLRFYCQGSSQTSGFKVMWQRSKTSKQIKTFKISDNPAIYNQACFYSKKFPNPHSTKISKTD